MTPSNELDGVTTSYSGCGVRNIDSTGVGEEVVVNSEGNFHWSVGLELSLDSVEVLCAWLASCSLSAIVFLPLASTSAFSRASM